jgi:hypothetical protein
MDGKKNEFQAFQVESFSDNVILIHTGDSRKSGLFKMYLFGGVYEA